MSIWLGQHYLTCIIQTYLEYRSRRHGFTPITMQYILGLLYWRGFQKLGFQFWQKKNGSVLSNKNTTHTKLSEFSAGQKNCQFRPLLFFTFTVITVSTKESPIHLTFNMLCPFNLVIPQTFSNQTQLCLLSSRQVKQFHPSPICSYLKHATGNKLLLFLHTGNRWELLSVAKHVNQTCSLTRQTLCRSNNQTQIVCADVITKHCHR